MHSRSSLLPAVEVFAVTMIGAALPAFSLLGRGALAVVLGLGVVTALVVYVRERRNPLSEPAVRWPLKLAALVLLVWLPSVALSLDPVASAVTWARTAAIILVGVVVWSFLAASPQRGAMALTTFIALTAMASVIVAALLLGVLPSDLVWFRLNGSPATLPNVYKASASLAACSVPLIVWAGVRLGGWWRFAAAIAVVAAMVVIEKTGSRSALAGTLMAGIAVGAVMLWNRRPVLLMAIALVIGVGAGTALWTYEPGPVAVAAGRVENPVVIESAGGYSPLVPTWLVDFHRQIIWQFTAVRIAERPWAGWGINMIAFSPGAHDLIPHLGAEYIPSHPHSWVMETLSETGVIGFVPLLGVVLAVFFTGARSWLRRSSGRKLAWLGLWVSYWGAGLFNFSFWSVWWMAGIAVLAAITLAVSDEAEG